MRTWRWLLDWLSSPTPPSIPDAHPWNTPKKRGRLYSWANRPAPQRTRMSSRERAKRRRRLKRLFGLGRRQMGAIGAGHLEMPDGYFLVKWHMGL